MVFKGLPKPVPKLYRPPTPSVTVPPVPLGFASKRIVLRPVVKPSRLTPSVRDSVTRGLDPSWIFWDAGHIPDPWQRKVLLSTAARQLFLCSRQVGKSTTAAAIALHHAIYTLDALILLFSPSLRQSRELFRRVAELRLQLLFQEPFLNAGLRPVPITITGGHRVHSFGRTFCVPRNYLISTLQILLQTRRLKIAQADEFAPILERELISFSLRRPAAADESPTSWRENEHDDLVFAVALPCFYFERLARRSTPAVRVVSS
jgi:hypothetical protein